MKLYENIRDLRIARGWSQDDLAHRAGYSDRSMITRIEKGTVDLSHSKIMLFAEIFNVDPVDLMGLSEEEGSLLSPSEDKLLRNYRILDQEDRQQVDMIMDTFVSKEKYKKDASSRIA